MQSFPTLQLTALQKRNRTRDTDAALRKVWGPGLASVTGFVIYIEEHLKNLSNELEEPQFREVLHELRQTIDNFSQENVKYDSDIQQLLNSAIQEGLKRGDAQMARLAIALEDQKKSNQVTGNVTIEITPYRIADESLPRIIEQCHKELLFDIGDAFLKRFKSVEQVIQFIRSIARKQSHVE